MALKSYAYLQKPRAPGQHVLHDVALCRILLEDPLLRKEGIQRKGLNPLAFPNVFRPEGSFVRVTANLPYPNALGELIDDRKVIDLDIVRPNGKDIFGAFWNPLGELHAAAKIERLSVSGGWIVGNSSFFDGIDFIAPDQKSMVRISDATKKIGGRLIPVTDVFFALDPAIVSVDLVRELVCDVAALLRLGFTIVDAHTDPKIKGMALILNGKPMRSSAAQQKERQGEASLQFTLGAPVTLSDIPLPFLEAFWFVRNTGIHPKYYTILGILPLIVNEIIFAHLQGDNQKKDQEMAALRSYLKDSFVTYNDFLVSFFGEADSIGEFRDVKRTIQSLLRLDQAVALQEITERLRAIGASNESIPITEVSDLVDRATQLIYGDELASEYVAKDTRNRVNAFAF